MVPANGCSPPQPTTPWRRGACAIIGGWRIAQCASIPRWRSAADHMANRLNRQELRGGSVYRVYRSASPYDGRFGPSPYASSGH